MTYPKRQLEEDLSHSRAAYLHSINALPSPQSVDSNPLSQNGLTFSNASQVHSMLVELGWAFFCRYEACFEAFLKENNVSLGKKLSLHDWLACNNVDIPEELEPGLKIYRKIRSQLHHEDGVSFEQDAETEIHLMPGHMEKFYQLFVWCGKQIQKKG